MSEKEKYKTVRYIGKTPKIVASKMYRPGCRPRKLLRKKAESLLLNPLFELVPEKIIIPLRSDLFIRVVGSMDHVQNTR